MTAVAHRLRAAASWRYAYVERSVGFALFRLYSHARYGRTRTVETADGRLVVRSDDYRGYVLARSLSPQEESKRVWEQLARRRPDLCVDVGANYGEFTAAIRALDLPTIVVEPNPALGECLRRTFAGQSRIRVVDVALSDEDGEAELHASPQFSGSGSLFAKAAHVRGKFAGQAPTGATRVRVRRLDALVAELTPRPPRSLLLKIDVEAAEGRVLAGASGLFSQCDWWRAIVEWNPRAVRAAGMAVDAAWATYRQWPGMVIDAGAARLGAGASLGSLPIVAPQNTCDVLLGRGEPT